MLPPIVINQINPTPYTLNLLLYQNADYNQSFTWQQNGYPVNLIGYTVVWTAESRAGVTYNWTTYASTPSNALGLVILHLPATITELLNTSDPPVLHDLLLIAPGGGVTRLMEGTVGIYQGVSV